MNIFRMKIVEHPNRHNPKPAEERCFIWFYDEDKDAVIDTMMSYVKQHGFSFEHLGKTYSCADIILTEETPFGVVISVTHYRDIFDIYGKRKK